MKNCLPTIHCRYVLLMISIAAISCTTHCIILVAERPKILLVISLSITLFSNIKPKNQLKKLLQVDTDHKFTPKHRCRPPIANSFTTKPNSSTDVLPAVPFTHLWQGLVHKLWSTDILSTLPPTKNHFFVMGATLSTFKSNQNKHLLLWAKTQRSPYNCYCLKMLWRG